MKKRSFTIEREKVLVWKIIFVVKKVWMKKGFFMKNDDRFHWENINLSLNYTLRINILIKKKEVVLCIKKTIFRLINLMLEEKYSQYVLFKVIKKNN